VRDFGRAWREATSVAPNHRNQALRDLLGWATAPELAFDGAVQCVTLPYSGCYFRVADGSVYRVGAAAEDIHLWQSPAP
jgi:hypothetical protein